MICKWVTRIGAAAALGLVVPAVSFAMQAVEVEANVPFAFTAGGETFPAGRYLFTVDNPMDTSELTIQSENGAKVAVLLTAAESRPDAAMKSKLVFDKYGNDHFLSQVWVAGFDEARVLPKSEIQHEYAKLLEHREVPLTAVAARH